MTERKKIIEVMAKGLYACSGDEGETPWDDADPRLNEFWRQYATDAFDALEAAGYEVVPRRPTATATPPAFDFPDLGTGDAQ